MRVFAIVCCAFLFAPSASAESALEKAKGIYDMAKCLRKNTQTMCIIRGIADSEKVRLQESQWVGGRAKTYVVQTPDGNWYRSMIRPKSGADEMTVFNESVNAFISFTWTEGQDTAYDDIAKKPLMDLADKLDVELEPIAIPVWPFEDDGVFYELCYRTNKKTEECMYSAAAYMPGGTIGIYSLLASEDALIEDVLTIILSIDVPSDDAAGPSDPEAVSGH